MLTEEHKEQNLESEMWVSSHTQPCPNCAAKVERSGGCNHMICTVCGQHYCYVCGRDWCAPRCAQPPASCAAAPVVALASVCSHAGRYMVRSRGAFTSAAWGARRRRPR